MYRAVFLPFFACLLSRIYVFGQVSTEYISEETPVPSYYNLHLALERLRALANAGQHLSPRVLLIGEEESGKTSLMKSLANWAIRSGRARTEREVPAGEMADEGEGKSRGVLLVNLDTSEVCSLLRPFTFKRSSSNTGRSDYAWINHARSTLRNSTFLYSRSSTRNKSFNWYSASPFHPFNFATTERSRPFTSFNGFDFLVRLNQLGSTF